MIRRLLAFLALALLATAAGAEPCATDNDETRVTGATQCLLARHFGAKEAPHLFVWLHGDVSSGGPANYHFPIAQKATEEFATRGVHSVALVRPGYPDGEGNTSTVDPAHSGRKDHYTRENIDEVATAIRRLKAHYAAQRLTLIGHSGGAATAAILLGAAPDLADSAILVACPCDLVAWRNTRRGAWPRSEDPMTWAEKVLPTTRLIALTGTNDDNTRTDLARRYVDALRSRNITARFVEIAGASHNDAFRSDAVSKAIADLLVPQTK